MFALNLDIPLPLLTSKFTHNLFSWDTRENGDRPKQRVEAHAGEVNALAFSPNNEYVVCTGSTDKVSLKDG